MVRRVNEQSAKNEARMEMALDSIDTEAMQIEEDAQEIEGAELVKQFKLEMGMTDSASDAAPTPRVEIPDAPATIGRTDAGRDRTRTE